MQVFSLDRYSQTPIYEQMIRQVELRILDGSLLPKDPLPSVRTLSTSLGVNPNTLQKAYTELERRGLCASVPGSGRFVSDGARGLIAVSRRAQLAILEQVAKELFLADIPLEDALESVRNAYQGITQTKQEEGKGSCSKQTT